MYKRLIKTKKEIQNEYDCDYDHIKAYKDILTSLIRKVAIFEYNQLFGKAWSDFYDLANNLLGYDIRNRPGKSSTINKIKEEEFPKFIKIATNLCKTYEIDISNDAKEYKKILMYLKYKNSTKEGNENE